MPDTLPVASYDAWCVLHGVTHGHCADLCEHPQPLVHPEHGLICGRCWFRCGEITPMEPCDC